MPLAEDPLQLPALGLVDLAELAYPLLFRPVPDLPPSHPIDQRIVGEPPQIRAESTAFSVQLEGRQDRQQPLKDLLRQLVGVVLLETQAAQIAEDQRAVDFVELVPARGVGEVAHPHQK